MANILEVSLKDILPSSIGVDEQVQAGAEAIDPQLAEVSAVIPEALIFPRLRELPAHIVDLLAWQLHVDFYEPQGLSLAARRNLVAGSIPWHRKKGTPWAVRKLLADLGFQAEYLDWWEFGGDPYLARLKVWVGDDFGISAASKDLIRRAFDCAKSTRTHLDTLSMGVWMLDEFDEIEDAGVHISARYPLLDIYSWRGLRYGFFDYGDMLTYGAFSYGDQHAVYGGGLPGTPRYGDDMPDLMELQTVRFAPFVEQHVVPAIYGQERFGEFLYGQHEGPVDGGAVITVKKPLVYGRFGYGDGCPKYGEVAYGSFAYGGGVQYGGVIEKEWI